jgi:hypothetical protein
MFSVIRRRLTFANVAMTLALVFAMSGGAYAAKKYLITSTKQINPKVLKALEGARPAGPAGAQGPAGPQGSPGTNGKDGAAGKEGPAGKDGAAGKSVVASAASNAECKEGGTKLEVEGSGSPSHVCNGAKGVIHPGETLEPEASETGTWALSAGPEPPASVVDPISFTIPLVHSIANVKVEPMGYTGTGEGCPGTAEEAKADPGFLCVYVTRNATFVNENHETEEVRLTLTPGTVDGTFVAWYFDAPANESAYGTWAVTAE